jgi:serine/threonine-protein kinase
MQIVEGTRLGAYRVVRKIGEGGMGAVFEGVHERLQKRVAIKTLHDQFARDANQVARFTREGRAASRIRHGHVIDVTDVGMENGQPFLVMELLEGESLAGLLRRVGPIGLDAIADIALPVCDALEAAHQAGIIHRDLKPENIFLTRSRSGTDVHPVILDFGISAIENEVRMTKTAHFMGTPFYMSPEQAQSARSVDGRSDQFSLGLVLFELVTGRRALTGDSVLEVVHRVSTQGAIRLTVVRPDLPRAFTQIVDRMTELAPHVRFGSMREVGAALLPFASPRSQALWGQAFHAAGLRSSVPLPPPMTPSMAPPTNPSGSIPVAMSFGGSAPTADAVRPSFSSPGSMRPSAASVPATRPGPSGAAFTAPGQFSSPGQPHPVLTPSFAPRASSTSASTLDAPGAARAAAPADTVPPATAPPARSPVLLAVIAVAAVVGAVGIAFVVGERIARPDVAPATAATAPPSVVAPPASVAPPTTPPSSTIDVRLRAVPATAEIVLDGNVVGTGTYAGSIARDGIPHLLEVRAEGYIPHDIQFLDIAPVATISLDEVPRHHHGPIVAQRSQMTASGLVEAATGVPLPSTVAAPLPPEPSVVAASVVAATPPPSAPPTTQGASPPVTTSVAAGAASTATPTGPSGAGQAAGTGVGIAPPPPTSATPAPSEVASPPPTSAAPPTSAPPPSRTHDDWGGAATEPDDLVPFE